MGTAANSEDGFGRVMLQGRGIRWLELRLALIRSLIRLQLSSLSQRSPGGMICKERESDRNAELAPI